jgi:hypothetical protein
MPADAVARGLKADRGHSPVIGFGEFSVPRRFDQIEPPPVSSSVRRTFKTTHQKTLEQSLFLKVEQIVVLVFVLTDV